MTASEWQDYLDSLFPTEINGIKRPGNVQTDLDFCTDFKQFISQDPARFDSFNAFLRQLFSNDRLAKQWIAELQTALANQDFKTVTTSLKGLMSATDKAKLDAIQAGAEVNQNAFSNVNGISAANKTDALQIVAGNNVTVTTDAANKKLTISSQDTKYDIVSTTSVGLVPVRDGSTTKYLRADGTWSTLQIPSSLPANGGNADTVGGYTAEQLQALSNIAILTGSVAHGGTIPLPEGYTQEQCKWMVSSNWVNAPGGQGADTYVCRTNADRVVEVWGFIGDKWKEYGSANYMIIGVK